jgi:thymidylate synthase
MICCLLTYICSQPGEFIHTMGDCHVYLNHMSALKEQITRTPKKFPKLQIIRKVESIDDFKSSDFQLDDYHPHAKLSMPMAV